MNDRTILADSSTPGPRSGRGFTLTELLLVIVIISLLIAITLTIGARVRSTGRSVLTSNVLRVLETSMTSYIADSADEIPASSVRHPGSQGGQQYFVPMVDGVKPGTSAGEQINTVGWYAYQMDSVGSVKAAISGLDPKVLRLYTPDNSPASLPGEPTAVPAERQPLLPTIFDGWGRPIRYVHPAFDGVVLPSGAPTSSTTFVDPSTYASLSSGGVYSFLQVRRNSSRASASDPNPDSDGGICPNDRPYFYSVGEDGDPSTTNDNVYTTVPKFVQD